MRPMRKSLPGWSGPRDSSQPCSSVALADVVDAYEDLTVVDLQGGHNTKDNDLWIAATAKATDAHLLTCDHDFDWLNPAIITVHWISQVI
jgi:predicted nuclease of predicted toxin-antitoxin system